MDNHYDKSLGESLRHVQRTEKLSQPQKAVKTLPRKQHWSWVSEGREELARQSGEERILPGTENSMCKGQGVVMELEV